MASDDFLISSNNCPASLSPGKSCAIKVKFSPDETGKVAGTVFVTSSDPNSPQEISLSGTGQ